MHLKVLFSFHFPLHLKSLVFLHFSFIPRLACAESNYNTLNLQETQSSPKCSLGSPYMCSLALSCNNYCHPRVSSCVQVPLWHTASPPVTAKWIQDGVCLHVASAFVPRSKGNALSARMPCPTFPSSVPFCRKGFLQLLWRNRDGGIPTNFSRTSSFPLLKAEQWNQPQAWPDWHLCQGSPDFSEMMSLTPMDSSDDSQCWEKFNSIFAFRRKHCP